MSTNIGPLTTTFTPPSLCATATGVTQIFTQNSQNTAYYYFGGALDSSCFPSAYKFDYNHYYSPGLCPSGFTAACSSTNAIGTLTETIRTCCPTDREFVCQSPGVGGWGSTLGCTSGFSRSTVLPTVTVINLMDVTSTMKGVTESAGGGMNALAVVVKFQASDFSTTTTSLEPTSGETSSTPSESSSSTSTANPSPSRGLSTGAKAGIAVGAAVAALGVLGLLLFFARRLRKQKSRQPNIKNQDKRIVELDSTATTGGWARY